MFAESIAGLGFAKKTVREILILPRQMPHLFNSVLTRPARGLLMYYSSIADVQQHSSFKQSNSDGKMNLFVRVHGDREKSFIFVALRSAKSGVDIDRTAMFLYPIDSAESPLSIGTKIIAVRSILTSVAQIYDVRCK